MAVSPDGRTAYVANSGSDTVSVFDVEARTLAARLPVPEGPQGIAVDGSGRIALVTSTIPTRHRISLISAPTDANPVYRVTRQFIGGEGAGAILVTADGSTTYTANAREDGVSFYRTSTGEERVFIQPVGDEPVALALDPLANRLYVSNLRSDNVAVIDTELEALVGLVDVGRGPRGIAVDTISGRVYVANKDDDTVSVIDTDDLTVIATIPVGDDPVAFGHFVGRTPIPVDVRSLLVEMGQPAPRIDNDGDGLASPSEVLEFAVRLRNPGEAFNDAIDLTVAAPTGTRFVGMRANELLNGFADFSEDLGTATLLGLPGQADAPAAFCFELAVDNDIGLDAISVQGEVRLQGETTLTTDPSVMESQAATQVALGNLRRLTPEPTSGKGPGSQERFGESVGGSRRYVAVGIPDDLSGDGAVQTYRVQPDGEIEPFIKIAAPGEYAGLRFGSALALVGDKLAIGAPGPEGGRQSGRAYLYDLATAELIELSPPDGGGEFGADVALSSDRMAVGSPVALGGGAVHEFDFDGTSVGTRITPDDIEVGYAFGGAVEHAGVDLLIGATGATAPTANGQERFGAVYRFSSQRIQIEKIGAFADDPQIDGFSQHREFGYTIFSFERGLLIGAPGTLSVEPGGVNGEVAFKRFPSDTLFADGFEP